MMLCHNIIYIFIVKNEIIYLMQKNRLVYLFSSEKYLNFTFMQVIVHHSLSSAFKDDKESFRISEYGSSAI